MALVIYQAAALSILSSFVVKYVLINMVFFLLSLHFLLVVQAPAKPPEHSNLKANF